MKRFFILISFYLIGIFTLPNLFAQVGLTSLYLVGNATPSGWNISTPLPMIQDENDANIFTWTGALTAGEIKISSFTGDWCDGIWINAAQNGQSIAESSLIYTNGCDGPDNKWLVATEEAGQYKITVNLGTETISFEKLSNDASLITLKLSEGILTPAFNSSVYDYEASVPAGTTSVDITAVPNDIMAGYDAPASVDVSSGSGTATITLTAADGVTKNVYTINIYVRPLYFENLYLVGSASPVGWNIGTPEPMYQDYADTMVFRWEGYLNEGELKFSAFTGDWCDGVWIKASRPDQLLSATDYIYTLGCDDPDNKWIVTAEEIGYYYILINLRTQNVYITSTVISVENSIKQGLSVYPNPTDDLIRINLGDDNTGLLKVYSADGSLLQQAVLTENTSILKLKELKTSGLLFLKLNTSKSSQVFKVIVR